MTQTISERLAAMGLPDIGKHPGTGEEFTDFCIDARRHIERYQSLIGPAEPQRKYTPIVSWEGDGSGEEWPVYGDEITLTDERFAEAMARYEKARAEFERTNGVHFVPGPMEITGTFRTESGASIEAVSDGMRWMIVASSSRARTTKTGGGQD